MNNFSFPGVADGWGVYASQISPGRALIVVTQTTTWSMMASQTANFIYDFINYGTR